MKETILVVDDDIGALTLITSLLERDGYNVVKARGADATLELLNDIEPALIILDVMMPGMDGIDLCKVLREREDTKATPIIILSARDDADTVMRGKKAGATDYLTKPILYNDLAGKVRDTLTNSQSEA